MLSLLRHLELGETPIKKNEYLVGKFERQLKLTNLFLREIKSDYQVNSFKRMHQREFFFSEIQNCDGIGCKFKGFDH